MKSSLFLLLGHLRLQAVDSLLVLSLHLIQLQLFSLNDLSQFRNVVLKHLGFPIAVLLGFISGLLNKVACTHFYQYLVVVLHSAWHVQTGCERHKDLLISASFLQVVEYEFGVSKLLHCLVQLVIGSSKALDFLFEGFAQLDQLLRSNLGDVNILLSCFVSHFVIKYDYS